MLQLVNDKVLVLNPPKDNLIADAAKVEEILGVPPERVVDVMALRGDSIDNIPGAPGIGDKGSVELIKRFGTVEQALDRAAEVEKKTYRESLLNNREIVLFSKRMATIDCNVPVELDLNAMKVGRARHRRLAPALHGTRVHVAAKGTAARGRGDRRPLRRSESSPRTWTPSSRSVSAENSLAVADRGGHLRSWRKSTEAAAEAEPEDSMLLFQPAARRKSTPEVTRNIAISPQPGAAIMVALKSDAGSKS